MRRMAPPGATAAYLFLCIVFGGSVQGIWANLALQLLGIALIGYAATIPREARTQGGVKTLYWLLTVTLLVIAAQLIPLAPSIWTRLPGRAGLSRGFEILGLTKPAFPISESPFDSVMTLFAVIPAIAAFCAVEKIRPSPRLLALVVLAGTVLGVLVGAMQVGGGRGSWAYFYPITNAGAVGFFANQNHMATLLLISIPLIGALVFTAKREVGSSGTGRSALGAILLILVLIGLALNGSLAGYGLALPVLLATFIMGPAGVRWQRFALPISVVAVAAGVVLVIAAPLTDTTNDDVEGSLTSRIEIWKKSAQMIHDTMPLGSGLGTFQKVYRQYEDPLTVSNTYVNHAHNDYIEVASDLGLAGMLLTAAFLAWWVITSTRIWKSRMSTPFVKASTVVTAAVLVHSLVDFPLRTAAISAIFAVSLALMTERSAALDSADGHSARHVTLG